MEIEIPAITDVDQNAALADKAESYRRKQPKFLRLLRNTYTKYLSPHHHHHHHHESQTRTTVSNEDAEDDEIASQIVHNHNISSRKIELQRSLIDVLEDEREVLLLVTQRLGIELAEAVEATQRLGMAASALEEENHRLGMEVAAVAEENEMLEMDAAIVSEENQRWEMAEEKMRFAAELGRCAAENDRVGVLEKKIEVLRKKVCGLEKKNMSYFEERVRTEDVVRELCGEIEKVEMENKRLKGVALGAERSKRGGGGGGMWRWRKWKGGFCVEDKVSAI